MNLTNDCPSLLVKLHRVCGGVFFFLSLCLGWGAELDPPRFLAALAIVEGGVGSNDGGRAYGPYQMHAKAVLDVQRQTGWRHSMADLRSPSVACSYALVYLRILSSHLASGGCEISPSTMWAAWNVGPTQFRARGFSLARCPRNTWERARAMEIYYQKL